MQNPVNWYNLLHIDKAMESPTLPFLKQEPQRYYSINSSLFCCKLFPNLLLEFLYIGVSTLIFTSHSSWIKVVAHPVESLMLAHIIIRNAITSDLTFVTSSHLNWPYSIWQFLRLFVAFFLQADSLNYHIAASQWLNITITHLQAAIAVCEEIQCHFLKLLSSYSYYNAAWFTQAALIPSTELVV